MDNLEKSLYDRDDAINNAFQAILNALTEIEKEREVASDKMDLTARTLLELASVVNTLEERIISLEEEVKRLKGV